MFVDVSKFVSPLDFLFQLAFNLFFTFSKKFLAASLFGNGLIFSGETMVPNIVQQIFKKETFEFTSSLIEITPITF